MKRGQRRTHCLRGHLYDEANTYVNPAGKRFCRACRREWEQGYRPGQNKPREILDKVAVDRVAGGDFVTLNHIERLSLVHRCQRRGESAATIAAKLHCSDRTVDRYIRQIKTSPRIARRIA